MEDTAGWKREEDGSIGDVSNPISRCLSERSASGGQLAAKKEGGKVAIDQRRELIECEQTGGEGKGGGKKKKSILRNEIPSRLFGIGEGRARACRVV